MQLAINCHILISHSISMHTTGYKCYDATIYNIMMALPAYCNTLHLAFKCHILISCMLYILCAAYTGLEL